MLRYIVIITVFLISSCSFLNDKSVPISIQSHPSNADIYVDNKFYGKTPAMISLEPSKDKNYKMTLVKPNHGMVDIDLQSWYTIRGGRGSDTTRCALDALGTMLIIPAFGFYSVHCRDFKVTDHIVEIPFNSYGQF